jgi:hypothetical protein
MSEIWKDVVGFEGKYKVSNLGRVYSVIKNKILSPNDNGKGYLSVLLTTKNRRYIHRLVAEAFFEFKGLEVNHKNLNKKDNSFDNLEWITRKGNQNHMVLNGKHNKAKLTLQQAQEIRELLLLGVNCKDLAKKFKVTKTTIYSIKTRKSWNQ